MRRKLTIRYKIICLSCIMVLISTMIPAIWFFYEYYNSQTENAYHNITSSTEQLIVTLSKTFGSINNSALSMLSSDPIRDWLAGTLEFKEGTSDYYQLVSEIQNNAKFNVMFSESWLSNSITTGYLVIDGCCIEMLPQLSEHSIRPAQLKSILSRFSHIKNKTSVFLPPQTTKDEVAFIKQLTNANGSKQAYLILSIAQAPFQSILSNTIDQTTASISDQENIVYFSSNSNLVSEFKEPISSGNTLKAFKSNQENQFGIIRQIPQTEFLLNLTIPKNYYTNPIISTLKTYILFMIALLLFVIMNKI